MKKLILVAITFLSLTVFAQQGTQYKAVFQYKKIVNKEQKLKRDSIIKAHPEMADMMKKFQKMFDNRTFELFFDKNTSTYKEKRTLDKPGNKSGFSISGMKLKVLFKDISKKIFIEKRPLFEDTYLISDAIPNYKWQITGESKMIGNYTVIKAEGVEKHRDRKSKKEKEEKITAWFTPQIPIGNGPKKYAGLPGFIMEVDHKDNVLLCTNITVNPKDAKAITAPTDGKKVSDKEFKKIQEKMFEKMEKMYKSRRSNKGSDSGVIIIGG